RGGNVSRVLVVDDDVMLLKMAEQLLKSEYTVMLARSGWEAVSCVANGLRPDIILLDIDMPKMDGYATLRKLQELDPDIPVIFLTGLTATEYELKGLTAGAVDYITKPFVKEILLARLKQKGAQPGSGIGGIPAQQAQRHRTGGGQGHGPGLHQRGNRGTPALLLQLREENKLGDLQQAGNLPAQ